MDAFQIDFDFLPLIVQDYIAKIIVLDNSPSEALNFALSSRHCFKLYQRAKPRKETSQLSLNFTPEYCEIYNKHFSKPRQLNSPEAIADLLKQFYISQKVHLEWHQAINESIFMQIWEELAEAMKYTTELKISAGEFDETSGKLMVSFFSRLQKLNDLNCVGRQTQLIFPISEMIEALQCHRRLTFMRSNDADDTFLEALAQRTSPQNPIESLCIFSNRPFTPEGISKFLKKAHFEKISKISLTPLSGTASEYLECFKAIGTVENVPRRNAVLIETSDYKLTFSFPLDVRIPEAPRNIFSRRWPFVRFS